MYNLETKNNVLLSFKEGTKKMLEEATADFDLKSAMENGDVNAIREMVRNIQNIMIASTPNGINVPKVSLYTSMSGTDGVSIVNVTITNRINSEKKFSFTTSVTKEKATDKVFAFMEDVYSALFVNELVEENLKKVNAVISQIVAESGIEYNVKVVSSLGNSGKLITDMTDDEIVFVADESRVLALEDIIVLLDEPTEIITKDVIDKHKNSLVEELALATTPEQLIGIHGGMLISYIANISKRTKPMTIIKKVCNKNAKRLYGNKDTVAYYSSDNVFALVARRDGNFEVILSPFDTETLHKVDVDVLKELA